MKYDVDYFIEKFGAIPESMWCIKNFSDGEKRCANGHCQIQEFFGVILSDEVKGLILTFSCLNNSGILDLSYSITAALINDGSDIRFPQSTPKQRILSALYDIREKELSEANLKAVEEIVNTISQPVNV